MRSKRKFITLGAMGITVNKQGQYLLIRGNQRADGTGHTKWMFPGGIVEFGEDPLDSMKREVKEEIGVTAKVIYPYPIVKSHTFSSKDHVILLNYLINIGSQKITIDPHEVSDHKWVSAREVGKLDNLPLNLSIIQEATSLIKTHHLLTKLS